MKVVCISDTHNKHGYISVPDGDVLIHAGDMTGRGRLEELIGFVSWMKAQPHEHKILIAGNHDFIFENQPVVAQIMVGTSITYLQDSEVVIGGVKFYGSPWQPWFFDWAFNLPRGEHLREKWDLIPEDTDVLITHGPPMGILDLTTGGECVGCAELLVAVKRVKPKFHVFGHIHESYGEHTIHDTHFINASTCTRQYNPTNPPICFDI